MPGNNSTKFSVDDILKPKTLKKLFTQNQVAFFYYKEIKTANNDPSPSNEWRCRCGNVRVKGNGFGNLFSHVAVQHKDFEQQMRNAPAGETGMLLQFVDKKASDAFSCLKLAVHANLPLSFTCTVEHFRRVSRQADAKMQLVGLVESLVLRGKSHSQSYRQKNK